MLSRLFKRFRPPAAESGARADAFDPSAIPALMQAGRADEAERRLTARLAAAPDDVDALHFLGLIRHQSGRGAEAVELIGRAATLVPNAPFIQSNLAEALRVHGDLDAAVRHARRAVELAPDEANFGLNLALILAARSQHGEALAVLQKVLALQPVRVKALSMAADAAFAAQRLPEAVEYSLRAREADPLDIAHLVRYMRFCAWACDWSNREDDAALLAAMLSWRLDAAPDSAERVALASLNPFVAYEYPLPQRLRDRLTQLHTDAIIRRAGPALEPMPATARDASSRLRIGYLSADFHSHPTMHLMGGLFRRHDRQRFEIFAYSLGPDDGSDYRRRAREEVDHFIDIRNASSRDAAQRIRADAIDILVDLKGFTHEARPEILALRPAPLAVAWLGYPASTGRGLNDYAIVDSVTVPLTFPQDDGRFSTQFGEQLVRMPHSYQVNDQQPTDARAPMRSELGLPEGGFVFACFNHVYKIEPDVFAAWMRILARVPGSVLWLYSPEVLVHSGGQSATGSDNIGIANIANANLRRATIAHGIDPARLVFGGTLAKPLHLARLARADLFLDTGSINAHTSAADALWAGLPVLTCPGHAFTARVAASLVSACGLPQLAVDGLAAYEDTAVRLATYPDEMATLKRALAEKEKLPLFDTLRFARNLERAFEMMWDRHQRGLPPESFRVEEPAHN